MRYEKAEIANLKSEPTILGSEAGEEKCIMRNCKLEIQNRKPKTENPTCKKQIAKCKMCNLQLRIRIHSETANLKPEPTILGSETG